MRSFCLLCVHIRCPPSSVWWLICFVLVTFLCAKENSNTCFVRLKWKDCIFIKTEHWKFILLNLEMKNFLRYWLEMKDENEAELIYGWLVEQYAFNFLYLKIIFWMFQYGARKLVGQDRDLPTCFWIFVRWWIQNRPSSDFYLQLYVLWLLSIDIHKTGSVPVNNTNNDFLNSMQKLEI